MSKIILRLPEEFSFESNFQFLRRSPKEVLHRVEENYVVKLLQVDKELLLFSVREGRGTLIIDFLNASPSAKARSVVKTYVHEWFDLATDLRPFYLLAKKDDLLKSIVKKHYGYRIVGQPDLFESLIWAVLGQQINLSFAYTLKQRFVETYGEHLEFGGQNYYIFPSAARIAELSPVELLPLQFSRQKANYVVGIAQAFAEGRVSRAKMTGLSLHEAKEELMKIKGIGNWTANYALMKTFRHPDAFPLEDAGVHNAIKNQLGLRSKPNLDRVRRIFKKYKGWEAYATLYLWKSLV